MRAESRSLERLVRTWGPRSYVESGAVARGRQEWKGGRAWLPESGVEATGEA